MYRRNALSLPLFFFNDPATTEIYTLSLHDALPISRVRLDADESRRSAIDSGDAPLRIRVVERRGHLGGARLRVRESHLIAIAGDRNIVLHPDSRPACVPRCVLLAARIVSAGVEDQVPAG